MPQAVAIIRAGRERSGPVIDTLILTFAQRQHPRGTFAGLKGTPVAVDIAEAARLRTDDCLVLDDGRLVGIVAETEPVLEIRAADLPTLARIAWQLGDRHIPIQVLTNRLRVLRDPAIETLLATLGARVNVIEAPFEPEGGAYEHRHAHDHAHHHHAHDHSHNHNND
jgi:urease accessory protein